jgi:thiamine pyrophosphokinase
LAWPGEFRLLAEVTALHPKRIVIIANGDLENPAFYRELLREDDYLICADGGSRHARTLGLTPDLIIGDLDSVDPQALPKTGALKPEVISYPPTKDHSDLELAVEHAVQLKPGEILMIGALGGSRVDHSLFNLMLLKIPLAAGIPARIVDQNQELLMILDQITLKGQSGDYLSLFPLTADVEGVTTTGLKYSLDHETLKFASSRGLSNELLSARASVSISRGMLLVIKTRKDP